MTCKILTPDKRHTLVIRPKMKPRPTAIAVIYVNSTFVGFAPYDSPTVAISVALEDYDKHDVKAAKIAGIVLTAALAAQGA